MSGTFAAVMDQVRAERLRQERLRNDGKIRYTVASPDCPVVLRLSALIEEVGEVARCLNDGEGDRRLADELVQVAAVAVAWVEYLL